MGNMLPFGTRESFCGLEQEQYECIQVNNLTLSHLAATYLQTLKLLPQTMFTEEFKYISL